MGRPSLPLRLAAWLVTGPAGHLAAGAIGWAVLLGRLGRARIAGREPWS